MPRSYESVDVCGFYSNDGKVLNIPAERYVYDDKDALLGHYEYIICKYETEQYTLTEKQITASKTPYHWLSFNVR